MILTSLNIRILFNIIMSSIIANTLWYVFYQTDAGLITSVFLGTLPLAYGFVYNEEMKTDILAKNRAILLTISFVFAVIIQIGIYCGLY